jgi:hypothetical protein
MRGVGRAFYQFEGSSSSLQLALAIPSVATSSIVLDCDLAKAAVMRLVTVSLGGRLTRMLDWWPSYCGEALKWRR